MGKKTKLGKFRKDKFYKLAKETGFRSRAAFKLIQLNRKFGFLQQSQVCIDLCAAPGGWMQVAKQNMPVSSIVVGVDLFPIRPIPGCISLVEDITTEKCKAALTKELQTWKADVILHDGAPNVGKNWLYDAYQQICLTLSALKLSTQFLRSGGWFVTKVFRSKDYNALLWVLKQLFKRVHATKPSASRKESAEIFIVCQSYFAPAKIDPKFFDPKYVFEEIDLKAKNTTLLHPEKQKRVKAEGYTETDFSMRQELSVEDFMENDHGLSALQGVSSIKIDNEGVRNHPKTTAEILECCKDIKVLGRKDLKNLLSWWKYVREDLFKKVEETKVEEEPADEKPLTQEEVEEMEFEELEAKIAELTEEEKREAKRKRKKQLKDRAKLNEKMNLKMVIKGDSGPTENTEEDIFNLKQISTLEELENMQDVAPDMLAEEEEGEKPLIPKYKRYDKDDKNLDDDGRYENEGDSEEDDITESESDYDRDGLGLSDTEDNEKRKKVKKKKAEEHPLIKPCDYRDKDTKRQQRVQLWFEKDTLQNIDTEKDENYDLDRLAEEYSRKGVKVLGSGTQNGTVTKVKPPPTPAKKNDNYAYSTASESETSDSDSDDESVEKGPKVKKIRLNEEELAVGSILVKGKKAKRDLIDSNWNRYTFNDENLPDWFVKEEEEHMRKPLPVPKEFAEEYERKVRELNVRPIKKVMEAKARKKKRALKRMEKAKKKAEQILENQDATAQEKTRQLRNLYKKASQEKKKEVTYVVAKKHQSAKRIRRPAGVKGRFRVVDPRMKKDKRAVKANKKKGKKRG